MEKYYSRLFFPFENLSISDFVVKGRFPQNPKDYRVKNSEKQYVPIDKDMKIILISDSRTGYIVRCLITEADISKENLENEIV